MCMLGSVYSYILGRRDTSFLEGAAMGRLVYLLWHIALEVEGGSSARLCRVD